jgi:hypothetical protein
MCTEDLARFETTKAIGNEVPLHYLRSVFTGTCFSRRPEALNCELNGIELSHGGFDRRSSFESDRARTLKGPFRDATDFVKEFADFEFQPAPAFVHPVHYV